MFRNIFTQQSCTLYQHFKHNFGKKLTNPKLKTYSKDTPDHVWWLYLNFYYKDGIIENVERDSRDFKLFIGVVSEGDLKYYNPEKQRVYFNGFIFSETYQTGYSVYIPEKIATDPNWELYKE